MTVILTENLTKFYGEHTGIKNINLHIKSGEIFGLVGANGAGKSTLLKTLLNFLHPSSGKATILGLDIITQSAQIKKKVGYVPADVRYYTCLTGEELLRYTLRFHGRKDDKSIYTLAEKFQLDIRKKIQKLSTGNKKKVAILSALIHDPELLIMDEPTSGLDPLIKNIFFDLLEERRQKGLCVLVSGHNLDEIQEYCNRVALLGEGEIIDIKDNAQASAAEKAKKVILLCKDIPLGLLKELAGDSLKIKGERFTFDYSGNIEQLLAVLSQYTIEDIAIANMDLEQMFLQYYKVKKP